MGCVTPGDVNEELYHVKVQAPSRKFAFNDKGHGNTTFNIVQVGSLHRSCLVNRCMVSF